MSLIKIYPENPNKKTISQIVDVLRKGGIIIYPTDTLYGIGCDITQHRAIERICEIKGVNPSKVDMSFICSDLSNLSLYSKPVDTATFRVLKQHLPGAFTFILNASSQVPKILHNKKKTVGIRIPDNSITQMIVEELGNPLLSTSLPQNDIIEYSTDPELIYEKYGELVDLVIDGGYGGVESSTVVDCTKGDFEIIRQGKGILNI